MSRIGILAGAFDPIHLGHVGFIEKAIEEHDFDKVIILIEKTSRYKKIFAGYNDREKMIGLVIKQNPKIVVYEKLSMDFPLSNCLPLIKSENPQAKIYLLIGKDVAKHIKSWDSAPGLLKGVELVIAERDDGITSGKIRDVLSENRKPEGLDQKVHQYIKDKNIY